IGFIAGPVIGGVLGEWNLHAPFFAAAFMNGINLIMTAVLLKESKHSNKMTEKVQEQSILKKLSYLITQPNMAPLLGIFLIITLVSQVP
ncbi:TetA family tetracycline resistance MFS efflux pump, partial [Acinetobacter nosocomialis]